MKMSTDWNEEEFCILLGSYGLSEQELSDKLSSEVKERLI